jgi:ATP-binding cassette, subfamily B, multidrug efflux pump
MAVFRFFGRYLKKYRLIIGFIFFLLLINAFLGILNPYISGIIVDDVIVGGLKEKFFILLAVLFSGVFVKSMIRYYSLIMIERTSQKFYYDIRRKMYSKVQKMDFAYFDKTRTGNIMTSLTGDLEIVRSFIAGSATVVFESIFSFIFVMMIMIRMSFSFTMILLAVTPLIGFLTFKMTNKAKPINSEWHDQVTRLNSVVQENISGNKIVKAFSNEAYEIEKFSRENEGYRNKFKKWVKVWETFLPPINFLGGMMYVILILAGGIMVINGVLSYGQLVVFAGLVGTLSVPINMANWLSDQIQRFFASGEKIIEIMKLEPRIKNSRESIPKGDIKGQVEFRKVSFCYYEDKAINNISFTIMPGQTVGIIGPTGAGKTTLVNLICRFYEASCGEVLIDGINIRKLDRDKLRDSISMAMQDTFLFSDTVEGNIAYAVPEAEMASIETAARVSDAHDFILKLSEGYDTIVGERGVGLSGGQRQRVSLARSLLKEASILIFDDITSSVDVETEKKIQKSLRSIFGSKTTFIISHRISSVKDCDLILVLDRGKIIEQGNHIELLNKKGYYYNVFEIQSGRRLKSKTGYGKE